MKYEIKRFELFANSYVGYKISHYLRKKYGWAGSKEDIIDFWLNNFDVVSGYKPIIEDLRQKLERSPNDRDLQISYLAKCWAIQKEVTNELKDIAEFLRLDGKALLSFISSGIELPLTGEPRLVFQKTQSNQIYEQGFYIKVESSTTATDVKAAYGWIADYYKRVNPDSNIFKELRVRKPDDYNKHDLTYYSLIEKEMISIDEEKEAGTFKEKYGEENKLVSLAIERVVGFVLEDIENDELYDELSTEGTKKLKDVYYKVADAYSLPTPKRLKSILDLISK